MKKYLLITLILTLLMSVLPNVLPAEAALSGKGTDSDPYIINSAADFMEIKNAPSAYYILNNDITLPDSFVPFAFSGSLIGKDTKNLSSITVNLQKEDSNANDPAGLFTNLSGVVQIKNIRLKGTVTGAAYTGGFAGNGGAGAGSVIENCINEATIRGTSNVGGIVGVTGASLTLENCINAGNVYGSSYVGGITSQTSTGTIYLCGNVANVTGSGNYVAGIVARNYGFVNYCYNTGNIKGNSYVGGIIAYVNGKRAATYLYNMGTVEARSSSENNDCGGLIGGLASGEQRFVTLTRGYNGGDVISPYGNYNPIYPSYVGNDTSYIKTVDVIYLSDNKRDDGKEGTEAVTKEDFPTIEEFFGEFNSVLNKKVSDNNTGWMNDILSQLDCELAMFKGLRTAVSYYNGTSEMLRIDEDSSIVPVIKNSTTMVPVGFISRVFGADVKWIPENRSVEITTPDKNISIGIGNNIASVNGEEITLTQPAYIENGRTFVPIRAVGEMLDKYVYWHNSGLILIGKNKINPSEEFISLAKSIWFVPAEDLTVKLKTAQPGDEIIVANGTYKDVIIDVDIHATADKPVIIRAETPGGVEFTGTSRWVITGSYITIRDFYFNECISDAVTVNFIDVYNCRFTGNYLYRTGHLTNGQSALVGFSGNSKYNRVDHNTFERPQGMCVKMSISGSARETNNTDSRIDHNYFVDVRQCSKELPATPSGNGMEVVNLIGGAALDYDVSHTVEYNRFEDVYGDGGEGICLKSHGNKINYNTFVNSPMSGLSMRANENSEVIGNFWFYTKYGMRVYGQGSVFKNNYSYNSYRSGYVAHGGSHAGATPGTGPTQAASDYYAENNLTIYPNHAGLMHSDNFNADNGLSSGATRLTYKDNIFYLKKGTVLKDYRSSYVTYEGNKVNLSGSALMGDAEGMEGFEYTDVPLVFDGEIWLPENMLDFDKQGLISVSECGPELRWWESLLRYTPKYFFDIEPEGAPVSITPRLTYIKINTNESFDLRGLSLSATYDADYLYNKDIEKQYEDISYISEDEKLIIKDGYLSCNTPGDYKLKLSYKGISKDINVSVVSEYSGSELLADNFDDSNSSSYHAQTGSIWERKDGVFKSKAASQVINDSKVLTGNYEVNFDITLTDDSGSGAIGGGLIFGYRNTPDLSFYTLRFGDSASATTGFYEVDPQVTIKSSEMQISLEANKKYNVTLRVNGDTAVALVDGKIATVLENFKNPEGKIGFISYSNNSVIVDNLTVKELQASDIISAASDINFATKRVDSTMATVNFTPLEQKDIYYRTYRNDFQVNDSIDEDEGYTEVTIFVGEQINYKVKAFDEYGRIVGEGNESILYNTDGKDEFFTISDLMFKLGDEQNPYVAVDGIKYRSRGLMEGLSTYSDRAYVISELPERFKDCGFIKMNNNDIKNEEFKKLKGDFVKFNINRPATVYVLAATREGAAAPSWLKDWKYESVADVKNTISSPTSCWSKHFDVPANGETTVYLGGMSLSSQYHVYIKPDVMPEFVELKKIPKGLF